MSLAALGKVDMKAGMMLLQNRFVNTKNQEAGTFRATSVDYPQEMFLHGCEPRSAAHLLVLADLSVVWSFYHLTGLLLLGASPPSPGPQAHRAHYKAKTSM